MEQKFDREKLMNLLSGDFMKRDPSVVIQSLMGVIFALLDEIESLRKQNEIQNREVEELENENHLLKEEIKELKIRLNLDSHNSGKPPSSDGFKKPPVNKSLRKSSGRNPGGQPGHKGKTLEMTPTPERIVEHKIEKCSICGSSLKDVAVDKIRRRQVFDIPTLKIEATEHRSEVKTCPCCKSENRADFPADVPASLQYGTGIKSLVAVLMSYQFIPYERLSELFFDLFNQDISPGTFNNILGQCYGNLEGFESIVKKEITNAPVVCFDETGMRSEGKGSWLHSASAFNATFYHIAAKRGKVGMNEAGILPEFKGTAVHDGFKPYIGYPCSHALCNAHHLRELTSASEDENKKWAEHMSDFLLELKAAVNAKKDEGKSGFERIEIKSFEKRYESILEDGRKEYPPCEESQPKKRGRKKQVRSLNLLDRLWDNMKYALAFIYDFKVPFDNNLAERDIRMMKVKQKVSGSFRSNEGAKWFCRIRSYISTVRKNGQSVLQSIKDAFTGKPYTPKVNFGAE